MHIKNNQLFLGKYFARSLVEKFGSPLYVYEAESIRVQYRELIKSIPYSKLRIHFACKANTNNFILQLLKNLGSKIETVSKGEIIKALRAGFKSEDILYTSTSVGEQEMEFVARKKVRVNLDSLSQIELYGKINPRSKIGIRVNQGIGAGHHSHVITGGAMSKFGIPLQHLSQAKKIAAKHGLKITSLHQHIGSNVLDTAVLLKAADRLFATAIDFPDLESLDFGGGLGVPYSSKAMELDLKTLGKEMTKKMNAFCKKYGSELTMILEPGRFLVAQSGIFLATVTEIKENPERTFVGVDTGFNHLIRPAMYGSYHEIINASRVKGASVKADIVGNICESGDVFGRDRKITKVRLGDVVAIQNTGAYGYVMASRYNERELPKEILLDGNKIK